MPSKTMLFIYGFFSWIFLDVFINLCLGDNVYQERLIWLFFAIMINLFFALKLKKNTEMRWSIILIMVCLSVSYIDSLSVIGYSLYAYYRYQKSKLPTTLELNEIDKMQNATKYEPTTTVQDLQSDIWGGILYIAFSLPLVIYYLKKNWPNKEHDLPLFVQESSCSIDRIKSLMPISNSNN